ncbi:MAG: DUF4258 domain-containing protein [Chloroflexi bacterium]|nr:DUF4258 domain-containing protein [Chloroflexota bacterium]
MKSLADIRSQLSNGAFRYSEHAFDRAIVRRITRGEIIQASSNAAIIENYPEDKYGPSCLLLGFTAANRPIHIQVSLADESETLIITLYEPNLDEWEDYRRRR